MKHSKSLKVKLSGKLRTFAWRIHWLAPNKLPLIGFGKPHDRMPFDIEENQRTQPPSCVKIRCEQIYALELYGPAEIESLYASLEKLGWQEDSTASRPGPIDWIRRQRAYGQGGSYFNLGPVIRKKDKEKFHRIKNYAQISEDFEYIEISIFEITASLTALSIAFFINNDLKDLYIKELNKPRTTYSERAKDWSIRKVSPTRQKSDATAKFRNDIRSSCRDWISENAPGIFCGIGQPESFPSMEVLVCSDYMLDPNSSEPEYSRWRWAFLNISSHDVWTHNSLPGLQLAFCDFAFEDPSMHSVVTLDYQSFPEEGFKMYGGKSNNSLCRYIRDELEAVLIHQACFSYLKEQNKNLNKTREIIDTLSKKHKHTREIITRIRSFFSNAASTRIISKELNELATTNNYYAPELSAYHSKKWNSEEKISLQKSARSTLTFHSKKLMEEESALRSHLEQITTILNTVESITAQSRMERLTIIAVLVAIGSLWAALPELSKLTKSFDIIKAWIYPY